MCPKSNVSNDSPDQIITILNHERNRQTKYLWICDLVGGESEVKENRRECGGGIKEIPVIYTLSTFLQFTKYNLVQ